MAHMLSAGSIQAIVQGQQPSDPVLQILNMKKIQGNSSGGAPADRFRMIVADGKQSLNAMLATQLNPMVVNSEVDRFAVFKLTRYVTNEVNGRRVIIILGLDVLQKGSQVNKMLGNPESDNLRTNQVTGHHQAPPQPAKPTQPMAASSSMGSRPSSYAPQNQFGRGGGGGGFGQRPPQQTSMGGMTRPIQPASAPLAAGSPISKHVFPINSLNPYQNKWTIRARVTNKSNVRTWNNSRGDGKVFSVDLLDESDEIRATGFNELVDKFYDTMEKGKVYYISRGSLKTANKKYTSIKNDYELFFSHETVVEPCLDECSMPKMLYDFVEIKRIEDIAKDSVIDVIGIVKTVSDVVQITAKSSGRQVSKRELQLVDKTGAVSGTLWGDEAETFNALGNPVIAVKGARVSDFGGRSLSLSAGGSFTINPDHPVAHQLRGWYETEGNRTDVKSISGMQSDMGRQTQFKTLSQVKDENLGHGEKPDYFSVRATVVFFKKDNCLYKACPLEDQNFKVVDLGNGQYTCERLNRTFDTFKWRFVLQVNITDFTGEQWISCFNEAAELLVGQSAQTLGELKESNEAAFDQTFADANFAMYNLRVRAKVDTYNDEQRVKCTCVSVARLNFREESKKLIDEIRRLQKM